MEGRLLGSRLALALLLWGSVAEAQHGHAGPSLPDGFKEPMPLYSKVLGRFTRPISSASAEAQQYFDQGFQLMYAFDKYGAIRSFREAETRDANCAVCYWGEAWAWGSFLNGSMSADESPFAYAAIQQARKLPSGHGTAVERALIDAMSSRYVEHFDPVKRQDQDLAYADAMSKVHDRFPKDLDAGTLYAESLFVMEPRSTTSPNPFHSRRVIGSAPRYSKRSAMGMPSRCIRRTSRNTRTTAGR